MDSYLYLVLNLSVISVPFIFSFYPKTEFWSVWKNLIPGLIIMDLLYLTWDIIFTKLDIWSFNDRYLIGYSFLNLPVEEWLFFICIPYASLFIHFSMVKLFPTWKFSPSVTKILAGMLIIVLFILVLMNPGKLYTNVCFTLTISLLLWVILTKLELLQTFLLSYLFILIPFFIVNGILTGSFISDPVVWYNDNHNLDFRIGTIPFEDIFYGLTLLMGTIFISEKFFKDPAYIQ